MADVSNFKLGNDSYAVKDATARQSIKDIESSISTLEGNVSDINSKLEEDVAGINTKIDDLNDLTRAVNDFKNTIFVGDSYGQGWSPDGTYTSWEDALATILPNMEQSAKINGGGIGFAHTSASISQNALQCWNANKRSINWLATATAVIVMLGINDTDQSTPAVKANAQNFFEQVKSDCPNATIYYFFNTGYTIASRGICMACYEAAYSHSYIRCYESAWWMLLQDSYFSSDFKHPNAAGHQLIARKMLNALMGVEINNHVYLDISDQSGYTFNIYVTNDTMRLYLSGSVPSTRAQAVGHFPEKLFDTRDAPAIATQDVVGILGSGTNFSGSIVVAFGGSSYGNSLYIIHTGEDLTTGSFKFCKTFNVYSFFGE